MSALIMLAKEMIEIVQVPVEDADIDEMFAYADKNCDGKLSYSEFEVKIGMLQRL